MLPLYPQTMWPDPTAALAEAEAEERGRGARLLALADMPFIPPAFSSAKPFDPMCSNNIGSFGYLSVRNRAAIRLCCASHPAGWEASCSLGERGDRGRLGHRTSR